MCNNFVADFDRSIVLFQQQTRRTIVFDVSIEKVEKVEKVLLDAASKRISTMEISRDLTTTVQLQAGAL